MTRLPILTALAASATVAMSLAASAAPTAVINSVSGVWGPVTGGQNKEFFDGNSEVRWGASDDSRTEKSGYRFDGPESLPSEEIDAEEIFSLGTFTHFNNPIPSGTSITQAILTLSYSITFGDGVDEFDGIYSSQFTFLHDETPNVGPSNGSSCGNGGSGEPANSPPCADKVTAFLNPGNSDSFQVGDLIYFLAIDGFTIPGGAPLTSFLTTEGLSNGAQLNGVFTTAPNVIPLPAAGFLLLGALGGLGFVSRKRKAA